MGNKEKFIFPGIGAFKAVKWKRGRKLDEVSQIAELEYQVYLVDNNRSLKIFRVGKYPIRFMLQTKNKLTCWTILKSNPYVPEEFINCS